SLQLLNGVPYIPAHELRVPIDLLQGARNDVLLCRVDRPGEGFHPIGLRYRPRRRPERRLHHFVSHPAKEEGIGLLEVLDRMTMQVFVREHCTMIAAAVQCDVDGIPKASHYGGSHSSSLFPSRSRTQANFPYSAAWRPSILIPPVSRILQK